MIATPDNSTPAARKIRSFVRREGRITSAQRHALEALWPKYGLDADRPLAPEKIFGRKAPLTLEIGFGNGTTLARMAAADPATDFIGIEVHRPGIGRLLLELERLGLGNVRIYREDAVQVMQHCLPPACLDRLLLFFPDPWHKKRHHKRRLVQAEFIAMAARLLRPGGTLHMATDWEDYAAQMLEVTRRSAAFRNCAGNGDYSSRPEYRPVTRFEQRGLKLGHGVRDLLFERV
ncbi:MAG: tRNA (guanosine(46)-N7)-methyltransferase TrmB [Gammaproteobacteria bacterium]|jgi:tRNA (guanine-N7-)-methyltransferase